MPDRSLEDGPVIPETMLDALGIALSPGAETLLNAAALLARSRNGDVGPQELFVAALAIGMPNPAGSSAPGLQSSDAASDRFEAHLWLYNWFAGEVGRPTVDRFLNMQVGDAFRIPMPMPNFSAAFVADAKRIAATSRLDPQARALLGRASFIAYQTMRDNRYGFRHIVASLVLPDSDGSNRSVADLVNQNFKMTLTSARAVILELATRNVRSNVATRWKEIFENPPPASLRGYGTEESAVDPYAGTALESVDGPRAKVEAEKPAEKVEPERRPEPNDPPQQPPPGRPVITLSGFTSDSLGSGDSDPLGIKPDVQAFARLVCLEEATPPLSICLFGEWGSGKSTFMERLQREIAELTKPKPSRDATAPVPVAADEPKFVENIVQIKFNAWHFADASLWASLTAVFFDQLRRGGYDGVRTSDYKALIGKVADKVRSVGANAANALENMEDAKRKSDTARKALETAEQQLAASDLSIALKQFHSDFEDIQIKNADKLKEVGRRVYRDDLSADTRAFAKAAAGAASLPGQIALIGRVLISGSWPTGLGVLAIVLLAGAGVVWPMIDPTDAATWYQRIVAWGGGLFATIGAIGAALKTARPILDGASKYASAVETARTRLTRETETKREEAKAAAGKFKEAEVALADARVPMSNYIEGVPPDAPSTILRYFLFEDGDVRGYNKEVGIVSRARRSFEQLDSIVGATRKARKTAEAKRAENKELSTEEKALLAPADGKGFLVPDRIVLYIDDLDRCTRDQVYAVLQAIHLLLAFELFVVVVGVDVRWIEGAVAKHFEADVVHSDDERQRRKHAIDYLEKIFQIPFWLERLSTAHGNGQAGGSYAAYVRQLLKDNERSASGPNPFKSFASSTKRSAGAGEQPPDDAAGQPAQAKTTIADDTPPPTDEFAAVDAALASMKLEKEEIDFLQSAQIGAVASKSPRVVKRLVNIYRIVRARLPEHELEAFLGRTGRPPRYPVAALLAAIETGQPVELAEAFYPALALLPKNGRINQIWESAGKKGSGIPKNATVALLGARKASPELGFALTAVDRACGPDGATVGAYIEMARLVRRYSFNRYS